MKKLTQKEGVAIGIAIVVVAALLFGNNIVSFIKGGASQAPVAEQTNNMNLPQSGVATEEIVAGQGVAAEKGDTLTVHYVGRLPDGRVFDSSVDRNQPFTFIVGGGQVIRGWDEGMVGMKVGEKRRLLIAPDYGYGAQAVGPIPANSTLIFEVELLNIAKTGVSQ